MYFGEETLVDSLLFFRIDDKLWVEEALENEFRKSCIRGVVPPFGDHVVTLSSSEFAALNFDVKQQLKHNRCEVSEHVSVHAWMLETSNEGEEIQQFEGRSYFVLPVDNVHCKNGWRWVWVLPVEVGNNDPMKKCGFFVFARDGRNESKHKVHVVDCATGQIVAVAYPSSVEELYTRVQQKLAMKEFGPGQILVDAANSSCAIPPHQLLADLGISSKKYWPPQPTDEFQNVLLLLPVTTIPLVQPEILEFSNYVDDSSFVRQWDIFVRFFRIYKFVENKGEELFTLVSKRAAQSPEKLALWFLKETVQWWKEKQGSVLGKKAASFLSVVGPTREGKSALVSLLSRYFLGTAGLFATPEESSSTSKACTHGLWLYVSPIASSDSTVWYILDTEGLSAEDQGGDAFSKELFFLIHQISAVILYNRSMGENVSDVHVQALHSLLFHCSQMLRTAGKESLFTNKPMLALLMRDVPDWKKAPGIVKEGFINDLTCVDEKRTKHLGFSGNVMPVLTNFEAFGLPRPMLGDVSRISASAVTASFHEALCTIAPILCKLVKENGQNNSCNFLSTDVEGVLEFIHKEKFAQKALICAQEKKIALESIFAIEADSTMVDVVLKATPEKVSQISLFKCMTLGQDGIVEIKGASGLKGKLDEFSQTLLFLLSLDYPTTKASEVENYVLQEKFSEVVTLANGRRALGAKSFDFEKLLVVVVQWNLLLAQLRYNSLSFDRIANLGWLWEENPTMPHSEKVDKLRSVLGRVLHRFFGESLSSYQLYVVSMFETLEKRYSEECMLAAIRRLFVGALDECDDALPLKVGNKTIKIPRENSEALSNYRRHLFKVVGRDRIVELTKEDKTKNLESIKLRKPELAKEKWVIAIGRLYSVAATEVGAMFNEVEKQLLDDAHDEAIEPLLSLVRYSSPEVWFQNTRFFLQWIINYQCQRSHSSSKLWIIENSIPPYIEAYCDEANLPELLKWIDPVVIRAPFSTFVWKLNDNGPELDAMYIQDLEEIVRKITNNSIVPALRVDKEWIEVPYRFDSLKHLDDGCEFGRLRSQGRVFALSARNVSASYVSSHTLSSDSAIPTIAVETTERELKTQQLHYQPPNPSEVKLVVEREDQIHWLLQAKLEATRTVLLEATTKFKQWKRLQRNECVMKLSSLMKKIRERHFVQPADRESYAVYFQQYIKIQDSTSC